MWNNFKRRLANFTKTLGIASLGWAAHAVTGMPMVGSVIRSFANGITAHSIPSSRQLGTIYKFDNQESAAEAQELWARFEIYPFEPPYLLEGGGVAIPISVSQMVFADRLLTGHASHLLENLQDSLVESAAETTSEALGSMSSGILNLFGLGDVQ